MNLPEVLQENVFFGLHLVGLERIFSAEAMKVCMCRERCQGNMLQQTSRP